MVSQPKPSPKGIIAQTPAQVFDELKVKLIRQAKAKFILKLTSNIPIDEVLARQYELRTIVDAYTRGFGEAVNLWYKCLKDMDCCLPKIKKGRR